MECRWQGRVGPAATSGGALGFPDTCGSGLSGFGWAPVPTGSCCWPQPHREPLVLKAKLKWGSREGGDGARMGADTRCGSGQPSWRGAAPAPCWRVGQQDPALPPALPHIFSRLANLKRS